MEVVVVEIVIMGAAMVEVVGRPLRESAPFSAAFTLERGWVIQDPTLERGREGRTGSNSPTSASPGTQD